MADKMIINGNVFDAANDVWYTKPKVNGSGGKNVGILNKVSKKSLFISTPLMLTWGVNENDYDGGGKKTYDLALQFPRDQDSNFSEDTQKLLEGLVKFEDKIKADAISNAKEWFNKPKMTADVVDALWTPMLKFPKDQNTGEADKTRAPSLRVKIPYYDDVFKIELYNCERELIFPDIDNDALHPMNVIEKGQNIAVVIQTGGIWFANGKFGTTWKLVQAMVQPRASLYGKCHITLDKSQTERMKNEAKERDVEESIDTDAPNADLVSTAVDDSDDESAVPSTEKTEECSKPVASEPVDATPEPVKRRRPIKKKKEESSE